MILVNNLSITEGGPFTRFCPSDPTNIDKKSCIDLVLMSPNLLKHIEFMKIDSKGDLKMTRATYEKGNATLKSTDHYTIVVKFKKLLLAKSLKEEKILLWNTNKPGAWRKYEKLSHVFGEKIVKIVENVNDNIEAVAKKIEAVEKKINFACFGKVKIKKN